MGYDGALDKVFSGYVSREYDGGTYVNEVDLKDEAACIKTSLWRR